MKYVAYLCCLAVLAVACQSPNPPTTDSVSYDESIALLRGAKDSSFQQAGSPLPGTEAIARFNGLSYFPADATYRITAAIVPTPDSLPFVMPTTKSHQNQYRQYAWAHFIIHGQACSLAVYEPFPVEEDAQLFLPFRDATSGDATYGGGRYLDLGYPEGDSLVIDFNLAYNPYCVYNYAYSCPIPPSVNTLPVAIEAGEKMIEIPQP